MRRDLAKLVETICAIDGIVDVGLTTNGILLAPLARSLWDAGLRRINVSLDTMSPEKFFELTRRTGFEAVIEGILAAKEAGFAPVKINAVAIKGVTEDDVVPLAEFSREHGLELRFIEYMPLDAGNAWERGKVLFAEEILDILAREIGPLRPDPDADPRAPAARLHLRGRHRPGRDDRVGEPPLLRELQPRPPDGRRQAASGNCLFALDETDIREF